MVDCSAIIRCTVHIKRVIVFVPKTHSSKLWWITFFPKGSAKTCYIKKIEPTRPQICVFMSSTIYNPLRWHVKVGGTLTYHHKWLQLRSRAWFWDYFEHPCRTWQLALYSAAGCLTRHLLRGAWSFHFGGLCRYALGLHKNSYHQFWRWRNTPGLLLLT